MSSNNQNEPEVCYVEERPKSTYNQLIQELDRKAREEAQKAEEERLKRLKHNQSFVQIEKKNLKAFRYLALENPTSVAVLFSLVENMNRENAVMISFSGLEKLTGYSRATISRAIKYLEDNNWIQIIKIGTANAYLINSGAFWQTYGDKKVTSFRANILAFSDEQTKSLEKLEGVKLKQIPILMKNETVVLGTNEDEEPPTQEEMDL